MDGSDDFNSFEWFFIAPYISISYIHFSNTTSCGLPASKHKTPRLDSS